MTKVTWAKKNFEKNQKSKMAAIFHEKIRENNYNSSNIRPMWMQILIYELYMWHKYLGKAEKSPINIAELQRIALGTLDMFVYSSEKYELPFIFSSILHGRPITERRRREYGGRNY